MKCYAILEFKILLKSSRYNKHVRQDFYSKLLYAMKKMDSHNFIGVIGVNCSWTVRGKIYIVYILQLTVQCLHYTNFMVKVSSHHYRIVVRPFSPDTQLAMGRGVVLVSM